MLMMPRTIVWGLLLLVSATAQSDTAVSVDTLWGQLQDDGGIAVYMILKAKQSTRLNGATSPIANQAELHTHVTANDKVETRPVTGIDLPRGVKVRLEPGGLHLQLRSVDGTLVPGQLVPLTLHFTDGTELTVQLVLR